MAISYYTRAPRETPILVDVNRPLAQALNIHRQQQEIERQERKEAEESYLRVARVDPAYTMSEYWQKEQGKKLQEYQDYITGIYYNYGNKPPLQAKIDMQNHQIALAGWQNKLKMDQQKFDNAIQQIKSDPMGNKFDIEHFNQKVKEWSDPNGTGELSNDLLLPPLIKDLNSYFTNKNYKKAFIEKTTNERGQLVTREIPITDESKLKDIMAVDLFKDASLYRTITKEFSQLPYEEKQKYLDKYSGDYQKKGDNAIKDYTYEKYGSVAFKPFETKERPAPKERGTGRTDTLMQGSLSYEPTTTLTLGTVEKKGAITTPEGKLITTKQPILSDVDQYGEGYTFSPASYGSIYVNRHIDLNSGHLTKTESNYPVLLKDLQIKYIPYIENYGIDPTGKYRPESKYSKIKAIVVTYDEKGEAKALPLNDQIKKMIIAKYPRLKSQVENLPYEFKPKSTKTESDKTEEPGITETQKVSPSKFDKYKRK